MITIKGLSKKEYYKQYAKKWRKRKGLPTREELVLKRTQEFLKKSIKIHKDKYDYTNIRYKNRNTKVLIDCLIHGKFWQVPYAHMSGQGCPSCGQVQRTKSNSKPQQQFIKEAKILHKNKYDYTDVQYCRQLDKVIINCYNHGPFYQTPKAHLTGQGCPFCANEARANFQKSKGETIIEQYLTKHNVTFVSQKTFPDLKLKFPLRFDFYLPKYNLLIEYDGDQHYKYSNKFHGTKETFQLTQLRDKLKTQYAAEHSIPLLRIRAKKRNQQQYIESLIEKQLGLLTQ
jgi:very-short-patch-repair endonuclease